MHSELHVLKNISDDLNITKCSYNIAIANCNCCNYKYKDKACAYTSRELRNNSSINIIHNQLPAAIGSAANM